MSLPVARLALRSLLAASCAAVLACSPEPPLADGGPGDAGEGFDDAGGSPGTDAGTDAGANPGSDAGTDAGTNPGSDAGDGGGTHADAGTDAGDDAGPEDGGTAQCPSPTGRGLTFVRQNPMLISGLSVVMGEPTAAHVNAYYDDFGANAVHLWETGLPDEISAWHAAGRDDFRYITWVHKDGTSLANGEVLGGIEPLPGRIGYQIGDEPTTQEAFDDIAAGLLIVEEADPEGLRILNLNDTDGAYTLRAQAANLDAVDVLSYDHYSYRADVHEGLNDTRQKALAAGKPYWRYIKSFYYKDRSPEGTLSDLRWDAFVGAVYGFTGYTWFVYSIEAGNESVAPLLFETGGSFDAAHTQQYAYAATVNRELATLGRALVLLTSTDVRYLAAFSILAPRGISAWGQGAGGDPYLSDVEVAGNRDLLVGFFVDDCGERYVMLQSQQHAGGLLHNSGTSDTEVTLRFDFEGAPAGLDVSLVESLDLSSGEIVDLALSAAGASGAELQLTLPAGAPLLFKYATGQPFALQEP